MLLAYKQARNSREDRGLKLQIFFQHVKNVNCHCLKAPNAMTLGVYTSRSFIDCNLFQMGRFIVAGFLLTSASRGPSATAELLVLASVTGRAYFTDRCPTVEIVKIPVPTEGREQGGRNLTGKCIT